MSEPAISAEAKKEWFEWQVANVIGVVMSLAGGAVPMCTRRDGRDASGLRVDFTCDTYAPPLALEIWKSTHPATRATETAAWRLKTKLQELTQAEDLGWWEVALAPDANVKELAARLPALMRRGVGIQPSHYSWRDLERAHESGTVEEFDSTHETLARLGLFDLQRIDGNANVVEVCSFTVTAGSWSGSMPQ